jgi:hypothetical protein
MYQFFIAIGLILGVVVDDGSHTRTDTGSFRIPMAIQLVFPMILVPTLLFLAPESPRWLLGRGKVDPAKKALGRLYGKRVDNNKLDEQLSAMQNSVSQEQAQESSWRSIFSWGPEGRKAYLACGMQGLSMCQIREPLSLTLKSSLVTSIRHQLHRQLRCSILCRRWNRQPVLDQHWPLPHHAARHLHQPIWYRKVWTSTNDVTFRLTRCSCTASHGRVCTCA